MWLARLVRFLLGFLLRVLLSPFAVLDFLMNSQSARERAGRKSRFAAAVAAVEPLLADFGVHLEKVQRFYGSGSTTYAVWGQSEFIRIRMSITTATARRDPEANLLFLDMAPLGYTEPRRMVSMRRGHAPIVETTELPADRPLEAILRVVAPEVQFIRTHVRSSGEIREELERQVHLLVQHCRPMLEGDFSAWPAVIEATRPAPAEAVFAGPAEGETTEAWASKMKQMLSDAMEKRDYALASRACISLMFAGVRPTREERDACRLAARHELRRLEAELRVHDRTR